MIELLSFQMNTSSQSGHVEISVISVWVWVSVVPMVFPKSLREV